MFQDPFDEIDNRYKKEPEQAIDCDIFRNMATDYFLATLYNAIILRISVPPSDPEEGDYEDNETIR